MRIFVVLSLSNQTCPRAAAIARTAQITRADVIRAKHEAARSRATLVALGRLWWVRLSVIGEATHLSILAYIKRGNGVGTSMRKEFEGGRAHGGRQATQYPN
ncbi:hypothetical protein SESBI_34979 [Sesbania bispinosa]|nr:hypothetical protein SESBI_34979 [Sesbania bispinosa]